MSSEKPHPPTADQRSYGRKRGRKPSPRQDRLLREVLPRVRVDLEPVAAGQLCAMFSPPRDTVWLEVGFGGAEHLIHQARCHPDLGLIGCEPFEEGVVKALSAIEELGLDNIRVHPDDARPLLRALPPGSLSRVYVLFPDPWPKRKHAKRRLVSLGFLDLLARALRPGAPVFVATDIGDYARTVLEAVSRHSQFQWTAAGPSDWRQPWDGWPGTRYEAKALREGRRRYFLTLQRSMT